MAFTVNLKLEGLELSSRFPWTLGLVLFMAYPETQRSEEAFLDAFVRLREDDFFDRLEVFKVSRQALSRVETDLGPVALGLGLQPETIPGKLNPSALDEPTRAESVRRIKHEIDQAASMGILSYTLSSGPNVSQRLREAAKAQLVKSLVELADHASAYGGEMYLETFDVEHDKKQLIGMLDEAAEICKKVWERAKNVALVWDQSHAPLLGEGVEVLKQYMEYVKVVHVGCAMLTPQGLKDWHPVYHTPGAVNTEKDLAELLRYLIDAGFKGPIVIEVKPQEGQASEEVVNSAKGAMVKAYSMALKSKLKAK